MGKDQAKGRRNVSDIDDEDQQGGSDVKDDHGRNQLAGDFSDPSDAADNDDSHQHRHHDSGQVGRNGEALSQSGRHRVDLDGVTDAKGSRGAEKGKGEPQPLAQLGREGAHTVAEVVHRAPDVGARVVHLAIGDRANSLGILGGHAEQGDEPHVEHRARPAERNGGSDPGDVPGADRCRQRRHQRIEGLDLPFAAGIALVEQEPEAIAHLAPRHEYQAERQQNAGDSQHPKHRRTPGEGIDFIDECIDFFHPVPPNGCQGVLESGARRS